MLRRFENWMYHNIYLEGDSEEILLVKKIWWVCLCLAIPVQITLSGFMYYFGQKEIAYLIFLSNFYWLFSLILFSYVKKGIEWFGLSSQLFLIVFSFIMACLMGGILTSGGIMFLGLIGPVYALVFPNRRRSILVMLLYLLSIVVLLIFDESIKPVYSLSYKENLNLFVICFIIAAIFWYIALYFFAAQRTKALYNLQLAEEKSSELLLNILPAEIAESLKESKHLIADQLDEVTILFADLVNFTETVSHMKPKEIIELLTGIFSVFDELTEKYNLEKIKTIGDCYMAVAGAPNTLDDHAHAAVQMALDIIRYSQDNNMEFRIGINSGPVVAGVIGLKKFSYDLWGDAVNLASRLETAARPASILISKSTYQLIQDSYHCEYIGIKQLKGIGEVDVWEVKSKKT